MRISRALAFACVCIMAVTGWAKDEQKPTAEDIVARHLESIGTAQARNAIKSRTVRANAHMEMVVGPAANSDGQAMLVSRARQFALQMKFPDRVYPDEQFVFDGKDVNIGLTGPSTRSRLGDWLYRQDAVVRDGLLGGALHTSWALLDVRARQARLNYEGLKKIDGRELHDVSYQAKKADNDLKIHLYFEPDTYRHVKTVYTFVVRREMEHTREQVRGTVRSQARDRSDAKYRVEETFSEFRTADGITLPGHWRLLFTTEADQTMSAAFDFAIAAVAHNNVVD